MYENQKDERNQLFGSKSDFNQINMKWYERLTFRTG